MLSMNMNMFYFQVKLQKYKITIPLVRVHVVWVSVKQVGKLQLYSLFLVKGGAFIVEWNPRIVKDHTASMRGRVSTSKMANDSHTAHLCRGSAVWRKPRGLRRNLAVWKPNKAAWKCTDKWGARKGRQMGKGRKRKTSSSAPTANNIGWWGENKRRLACARKKNATCAWQKIWNSRGHGLCPLKDPETSYQKPTQGLGLYRPTTITFSIS